MANIVKISPHIEIDFISQVVEKDSVLAKHELQSTNISFFQKNIP